MASENTSESQLIAVLDRLTRIQEGQPLPQLSVTQAKYITPWNPTGAKDRPKLRRAVYQNGQPLSEGRLSAEEITLLNTLKNGRYAKRKWLVMEKDEDGANTMHFYTPNKTEAERMDLARTAPGGLVDILRQMHQEMKTPKVAE
jgi:hypothetical protein